MIKVDEKLFKSLKILFSLGFIPFLTFGTIILYDINALFLLPIGASFLLFLIYSKVNFSETIIKLRGDVNQIQVGWETEPLTKLDEIEEKMNVDYNGKGDLTEWNKMIKLLKESKVWRQRVEDDEYLGAWEPNGRTSNTGHYNTGYSNNNTNNNNKRG